MKNNKIYMLLILLATLCMCVGYATINSVILDIRGNVIAKTPDGLQIVDVEVFDSENAIGIINTYDEMFLDTTIELSDDVLLANATYVTLAVTLHNSSLYTYKFEAINYELGNNTYDNANIIFNHTIDPDKEIVGKETYTFYITYEYDNKALIENNILNNKLSILFYKTSMKLNELILINEEEPVDGEPGLYTYNETKKYYSGLDVNNYVWFNCKDGYNSGAENCETWRIISIEEEGEIKIIRENIVPKTTITTLEEKTLFWEINMNDANKTKNLMAEGKVVFDPRFRRPIDTSLVDSYCIKNNNGCNAYGKNNHIGSYKNLVVDEDSAIKLYLENVWFENELSDNAKQKLQYSNYNVGLIDTNKAIEIVLSSEQSIVHNAKIGLLNLSEYILATTESSCKKSFTQYDCSINNWLNTGEAQFMLLNGRINATNAQVWSIKNDGTIYSQDASYGMYLRPVVTLDKNIEATGSGNVNGDYYVLY